VYSAKLLISFVSLTHIPAPFNFTPGSKNALSREQTSVVVFVVVVFVVVVIAVVDGLIG